MRSALVELNEELERDWGVRIESRIGVNTGKVVVGEGESLAVGDAVNVAARLEQAAAPGETLLGETTYRLVRDAVEAEPVEPLEAKGKSKPLTAHRLASLVQGAEFITRQLDSPLVGRANELAQLQRAYDHAVSQRVAYQFTLLGPAGIGKSRLVRELHDRVDGGFLSGRCLPYGEGITYWPLAEIDHLSEELDFESNRDEIALRTRRILERLARERPLVIVFEDLQWAEPTFLDLVDHVADLARDAPMLLLCVARPELLEVRPGWGGGKLNATTMLLEALSDVEAEQLVDNLLLAGADAGTKDRITAAAEGNPLFVEEMLAMVAENGNGDLAVPPTIQALLAARLDRLGADERTVVECAAVQGQEFDHDALAALLPDATAGRLDETLQALVRKDLVRPAADETFSFKHLLLRDAAYEGLPKEQRADLHERFADRVEETHPELQEIIGYHLEQAFRYRSELGPVDEAARGLARRSSSILAAAGHRAADRRDVHATINLFERAVRLLPEDDPAAVSLYPDLGDAVTEAGDLRRPEELYQAAEALGAPETALRARLRRIWLSQLRANPMPDAVARLGEVVAEAEQLGNDVLIAEALLRLGIVHNWLGNLRESEELFHRSLERLGPLESRLTDEVIGWIALLMLWGPTTAEEALEEIRRLAESVSEAAQHDLLVVQGTLLALTGDVERGRELGVRGRGGRLERGNRVGYASISQPLGIIELLAGNAPAAERMLREAHGILSAAGERGYLSTISGLLALALANQGRYDEADRFAEEGREIGAEDDLITQVYWRLAKAHVLAARGAREEAARLSEEAIELSSRSPDAFDRPIAAAEVAGYLEPEAARLALEQALASATAKGNVLSAEQIREKLAALP